MLKRTPKLAITCFALSLVNAVISSFIMYHGSTCMDFFWTDVRPGREYFYSAYIFIEILVLVSGLLCLIAGMAALYGIVRSIHIKGLWQKLGSLVLSLFSVLVMPWLALAFLVPGNYRNDLEVLKYYALKIYQAQMKYQHKKGSFANTCDKFKPYIDNREISFYLSKDQACYYGEYKNWTRPLPPDFKPFVSEKRFVIIIVANAGCKQHTEVFAVNETGVIERATKGLTWRKAFSSRMEDAYDVWRMFYWGWIFSPYYNTLPFT